MYKNERISYTIVFDDLDYTTLRFLGEAMRDRARTSYMNHFEKNLIYKLKQRTTNALGLKLSDLEILPRLYEKVFEVEYKNMLANKIVSFTEFKAKVRKVLDEIIFEEILENLKKCPVSDLETKMVLSTTDGYG